MFAKRVVIFVVFVLLCGADLAKGETKKPEELTTSHVNPTATSTTLPPSPTLPPSTKVPSTSLPASTATLPPSTTTLPPSTTTLPASTTTLPPSTTMLPPKKPDAPQNFTVTSVRSTEVTLNWSEPEEWNGVPGGYILQTKTQHHDEPEYRIRLKGKDNRRARVTNLQASTEYTFLLGSYTTGPDGEVKSYFVATTTSTLKFDEPSSPRNVKARPLRSNTVILTWDQPLIWNADNGGYIVTTAEKGGPEISVRLNGKNTLRFSSSGLKPKTSYIFTVTAFNRVDSEEKRSTPVELLVRVPPTDGIDKPHNVRALNTTTSTITLTWDQDGDNIIGYNVTYSLDGTIHSNFVTNRTHTITGLKPWSYYFVLIYASGTLKTGADTSEPAVTHVQTQMDAPSQPVNIRALNITSNTLELKWDPPSQPNGPVSGYIVSWKEGQKTKEMLKPTAHCVIGNLTSWTPYTVNIVAFNVLGNRTLRSDVESFGSQTEPSAPSAPQRVRLITTTSTSLVVDWQRPSSPNGPISGYSLLLSTSDGKQVRNVSLTQNDYVLDNLSPWTDYKISVAAFNTLERKSEDLFGPTQALAAQTYPDAPSVPVSVTIANATNTTLELKWDKPSTPNGPLTGYILRCSNGKRTKSYSTNETELVIPSLKPWTNYTVQISAYNWFNKVPLKSETVQVEGLTSATAPPFPEERLSVTGINEVTASLQVPVDMFSKEDGPIVEYVLLVAASDTNQSASQQKGYESLNGTTFAHWSQTKKPNEWYRSSPVNWIYETDGKICSSKDPKTRTCIIGKDSSCTGKEDDFCDGPLQKNTRYWAKIRAYTEGGWSETSPVSFVTGASVVSKPIMGIFLLNLILACYYKML